jgi:hypothetical protein
LYCDGQHDKATGATPQSTEELMFPAPISTTVRWCEWAYLLGICAGEKKKTTSSAALLRCHDANGNGDMLFETMWNDALSTT